MQELNIIEWNINGRCSDYTGYIIPSFVINQIFNNEEVKADIIIFTEFIRGKNWDIISKDIGKNYHFYTYKIQSNQNEVLIAIKKKIVGIDYNSISAVDSNDIKSSNIKNSFVPNFLHLRIKYQHQYLNIIGVRIIDDNYHNKKEYFDTLIDYIKKEINNSEAVIVAGDFNHGAIKNESENYSYSGNPREHYNYQMIRRIFGDLSFETHTPDTGNYGVKYSWVMKEPNIRIKEDHFFSRCLTIQKIDYHWDFVNKNNGYENLKPTDYKSHLKLPDHAILSGKIVL